MNRRHTDFQSVALPTELPALIHFTLHPNGQDYKKIRGKLHNFDCPKKQSFHRYRKQRAYKHDGKSPAFPGYKIYKEFSIIIGVFSATIALQIRVPRNNV